MHRFYKGLIYVYAFSRRFYQKWLSAFRLYILYQYVFPGNWTHNLCTANAMLYHWATQEPFVQFDGFSL